MDHFKTYRYPDKIRLGCDGDGGYVIADIPHYDCYISAGVSSEESFSRDFIAKYSLNRSQCFAFDGTIEDYPWQYTKNIQYVKKNISHENSKTTTNLNDIMMNHKNIFLKMDIEHHEYLWLHHLDPRALLNFKQMVIEFHDVNSSAYGTGLNQKLSCFYKLADSHYLVHAHGNNFAPAIEINKNKVPTVLELTYVRKDVLHDAQLNDFPLPGELDTPNRRETPDYNLNFYPFYNK